jgi:hypothetical protein
MPRLLGTPLMPVREAERSGGTEETHEENISLGRPAMIVERIIHRVLIKMTNISQNKRGDAEIEETRKL